MAKIKNRNPHAGSHLKHKPRGTSGHAFQQVYWPYLPLIAVICLLLGLIVKSGPISSIVKHPTHSVLAYATSTSLDGLLQDTNTARAQNHQAPLSLNGQLDSAAQAKASDMAKRDYWSHNTPDGQEPWVFVTSANYNYQKLGENLATGFSNDQSVVSAWLASPAHRENLLDPNYQDVGFGFANVPNYTAAGGGPMTVVVAYYGRPANASPVITTSTNTSGISPALTSSGGGQALGDQTSRLQIALGGNKAAAWSSTIIIAALAAVLGLWVGRHFAKIKRSVRHGERYVFSHPLMDAGFLVVLLLLLVLGQTSGFIQ